MHKNTEENTVQALIASGLLSFFLFRSCLKYNKCLVALWTRLPFQLLTAHSKCMTSSDSCSKNVFCLLIFFLSHLCFHLVAEFPDWFLEF